MSDKYADLAERLRALVYKLGTSDFDKDFYRECLGGVVQREIALITSALDSVALNAQERAAEPAVGLTPSRAQVRQAQLDHGQPLEQAAPAAAPWEWSAEDERDLREWESGFGESLMARRMRRALAHIADLHRAVEPAEGTECKRCRAMGVRCDS